ncbi:MAG: uracil permease, partial [Draconibacterium sp.]
MKQTFKNQLTFKNTILGVQFLFVAFGATVLVPLFHLVTKGSVPVFLGSSFAFIPPIIEATKLYGLPGTLSSIIAVGIIYTIFSAIVKVRGLKLIQRLFPAVVVGPVIMIIGLSLASVAVDMAKTDWTIAVITLGIAVAVVIFGKGMIKLIPIFIAIIGGYIVAAIWGKIDYTAIQEAAWFSLPNFTAPKFHWQAILYMIPVAVAPIIEHVGDMYAIGGVCEKDFVQKPGLHRTLLGDGLATSLAGFFGGVPNTTYSEVTGAISLTKVT